MSELRTLLLPPLETMFPKGAETDPTFVCEHFERWMEDARLDPRSLNDQVRFKREVIRALAGSEWPRGEGLNQLSSCVYRWRRK